MFVPLWRDSGLRWPLLSGSLRGTFIPRSSPAFCATSRGRSLRWVLRSPVPTLTAKQENYQSFPHANNTNCTLSLCIHRSLLSMFSCPLKLEGTEQLLSAHREANLTSLSWCLRSVAQGKRQQGQAKAPLPRLLAQQQIATSRENTNTLWLC